MSVREAAERMRKVFDGQEYDDVYGPLETAYEIVADSETLAKEYLAEHPADGDEPITVERLTALGFDDVWGCSQITGANGNCVSVLTNSHFYVFVQGRKVEGVSMMFQLCKLLEALGIKTKENK